MSIQYGVTTAGFVTKPQSAILTSIETDQQDAFGASFNTVGSTAGKSVAGVCNGIMSESFANLWFLLEAICASQNRDAASGALLAQICALTGTLKNAATSSAVTLTLIGTNGTLVPATTQVATASTNVLFVTNADATIVTLASWAQTTAYAIGALVKNSGNVYYCVQAGTSSSSPGGPTATTANIADGGVIWDYAGAGSAAVNVTAHSADTGAVVAVAGDLTVKVNPVVGWTSVVNVKDATFGVPEPTDEQLRVLAEEELAGEGTSPANAIRAALLKIIGVTSCTVFQNVTDATDANGLPPHSVRALVQGGADQDIRNILLSNVAAGIVTDGTTVGTATDSQGTAQTVKFTRPTAVNMYVDATLTYDASAYPSDGDAEVKSDIATFGNAQSVGKDAVASSLGAQAFKVTGVLDVSQTLVYNDVIGTPAAWVATTAYSATVGARSVVTNDGGRTYICITAGTSAGSGGPTGTATDITDNTAHWRFLGASYVIDSFSLAAFDTSRMTVHSSSGTP